ncbi:MAG: hypothetical protein PUB52_11560 [Lachnospiraceae bacterium]|nr:hypothetical protein [Lachnospiraceae bacterium]
MRTNFTHLSGYPKFYETAVSAEGMILAAKNPSEMKMAGNAMRQVAEGLMKECLIKYGIQSDGSFRKNFNAARRNRIISRNSQRNFGTLIDYGNLSSHPGETITRQQLVLMYELLYEESYKMVNYYLKDQTVKKYKAEKQRSSSRDGRPRSTACTPARPTTVPKKKKSIIDSILVVVIWGFVILMLLSFLSVI